MKEMLKKHDLFKIVAIVILFVALLTWIIPVSQYTGTEMYIGEISRLGIVDLFGSGLYSLSTILYQVSFLIVLGGFYGVLSQLNAYKNLVTKIVNKLKGKEIAFILITSFVYAGLASITSEIYNLLLFVPFIITIILNLKLDKFNAISTTFGSILIGRLGATYSPYAYNYINSYFTMEFNTEIITKVAIFVLTFILFNFFNFLHAKSILKSKSKENYEIDDKFGFIVEEKKSKSTKTEKKANGSKAWPLMIIFLFIAALQILGFVAWNTSFKIEVFDNFHTWLTGIQIGGYNIFSYLMGSENIGIVKAFGSWDLFNLEVILILATLIIALAYKIGFDKLIEDFISGIKKISRLILLLVMIYAVFIIVVWNPIVPTIVDWIVGLTSNFNIYLASLATFIASIFNVDMDYTAYTLGSYFVSLAGDYSSLSAIIMNSMHGLAGFIAPTSGILMLGLAYLNIPYKDWMKYIWRFLLGLTVGLLIIFTIIRYM